MTSGSNSWGRSLFRLDAAPEGKLPIGFSGQPLGPPPLLQSEGFASESFLTWATMPGAGEHSVGAGAKCHSSPRRGQGRRWVSPRAAVRGRGGAEQSMAGGAPLLRWAPHEVSQVDMQPRGVLAVQPSLLCSQEARRLAPGMLWPADPPACLEFPRGLERTRQGMCVSLCPLCRKGGCCRNSLCESGVPGRSGSRLPTCRGHVRAPPVPVRCMPAAAAPATRTGVLGSGEGV